MGRYNEKSKEATMKYIKNNLDEFKLRYPKGTKDNIRKHIEKYSEYLRDDEKSMQGFIKSAIDEKMMRNIEQYGE